MIRALSVALLLFPATHLLAQDAEIQPLIARTTLPSDAGRPSTIRVTSNLVLLPVHVTNRAGASVTGLHADAFSVFEDKVPQPIVSFGSEDVPSSIGVILDLSGSMKTELKVAASMVRAFFEAANPEDEAFLMAVSTRPRKLDDFTVDFGSLESSLIGLQAGGATALNDTILIAVEKMRQARYAHKALLIVSDGVDNHSRYTAHEVMRIVDESDVQIYTIGVDTWSITKKPIEVTEDRNGQAFLQKLSGHSGGLKEELRDFDQIPAAAAKISCAIRDQYVIGYRPSPASVSSVSDNNDAKWRTIQVTVNKPQMQVSSRAGYYMQ